MVVDMDSKLEEVAAAAAETVDADAGPDSVLWSHLEWFWIVEDWNE